MNKRFISLLLILFFVVIIVTIGFAGPPDPDPCGNGQPCIPIDGGAGFLLAAGVAYGIYRFKKNRKS